jgi:hypothetical protein
MSIMRVSRFFPGFTIAGSAIQLWTEQDNPYGTLISSSSFTPTDFVSLGKEAFGGAFPTYINRWRYGISFTVPSYSGTPNSVKLIFPTYAMGNVLESFLPAIYLSNTDDSAFATGWQNNINNFCGYGVYIDSPSTPYYQTISIPVSLLSPGRKFSFIIGQQYELLGTGAGGYLSTEYSYFALNDGGVNPPHGILVFA